MRVDRRPPSLSRAVDRRGLVTDAGCGCGSRGARCITVLQDLARTRCSRLLDIVGCYLATRRAAKSYLSLVLGPLNSTCC